MQSGSAKSHPKPAASTGKAMLSSSSPSVPPPSLKRSEYVEEISDSEDSGSKKYIGSDDEAAASQLETIAGSKNPETHVMEVDPSSGVRIVTYSVAGNPVGLAARTTSCTSTMELAGS